MPPLLRFALRAIAAIAIITFLIQPYNWYCQLTQSCSSFHLSYYMPKKEGKKEFEVEFEVSNYMEDVQFFPEEKSIMIKTNRKHTVSYQLKNLSKKSVVVRPRLIIEPQEVEKYFVRYQCLCAHQYKLKALEEITLKMEFEIDKDFETDDDQVFERIIEQPIKIRYKI